MLTSAADSSTVSGVFKSATGFAAFAATAVVSAFSELASWAGAVLSCTLFFTVFLFCPSTISVMVSVLSSVVDSASVAPVLSAFAVVASAELLSSALAENAVEPEPP